MLSVHATLHFDPFPLLRMQQYVTYLGNAPKTINGDRLSTETCK